MSAAAFLAALQLADSALPTGRFAHSAGLEALVAAEPETGEAELVECVATHVLDSAGPLDGVVVAAAHRRAAAGDLAGLLELDRLLTAYKLTPPARLASTTCGRRLAALTEILSARPPAASFCAAVRAGETDGHLAVVHGALAQGCGIALQEAVLIELRSAAAALLSALVRLGRLSAVRAQGALRELAPALEAAAGGAAGAPLEALRSTAPELEVFALAHRRADARHFVT